MFLAKRILGIGGAVICLAVLALIGVGGIKQVGAQSVSPVGSWYGYAALGPANVYMMPTFFQDGTIIANDIEEFVAAHTTSHGAWQRIGARGIKANFVWINAGGTATRVVLEGQIDPGDQNSMTGTVSPYFCAQQGNVELSSCTLVGVAEIKTLKRIQVQ